MHEDPIIEEEQPMVDILFISDYVCPNCIVAKAALKEALKEVVMLSTCNKIPSEEA